MGKPSRKRKTRVVVDDTAVWGPAVEPLRAKPLALAVERVLNQWAAEGK